MMHVPHTVILNILLLTASSLKVSSRPSADASTDTDSMQASDARRLRKTPAVSPTKLKITNRVIAKYFFDLQVKNKTVVKVLT